MYSKSHKKNFFLSYDKFRFWSKKIALLTNFFYKKQLFGHITFFNKSFSYIKIPHGIFLGSYIKTVLHNYFLLKNFFLGIKTKLKYLNKNIIIFDVEKIPFTSALFSKSNGCYSIIISQNLQFNLIKLKLSSAKNIYLNENCFCSIGRNTKIFQKYEKYKKASFFKNLGYKQKVRGVAKNPVDHPHGGRTKTNKPEVSIWGWVAKHSH